MATQLEHVLPDLRAGKRIRRMSDPDCVFQLGTDGEKRILVLLAGGMQTKSSFDATDLLAEDWEVCDGA